MIAWSVLQRPQTATPEPVSSNACTPLLHYSQFTLFDIEIAQHGNNWVCQVVTILQLLLVSAGSTAAYAADTMLWHADPAVAVICTLLQLLLLAMAGCDVHLC